MTSVLEKVAMHGIVVIIKRTRRKGSVSFRMLLGQLVVLVPNKMPRCEIDCLLESKSDWILAKVAMQDPFIPPVQRRYVTGERLYLLDQELILQIYLGSHSTKLKGANEINVSVPSLNPIWIRNALVRWYKLQAQEHVEQRVSHFAPLVGAWPKKIDVKTYRARWGSCNHRGEVQFNWKLMMAPSAVFDSVVVHELCHLLHMHHGPEFWAQVKRVLPNYPDAKQWLKDEGHRLGLD